MHTQAPPAGNSALRQALNKLDVHDHLCLIYKNREEQFAAAIPFIRRGIELNQKCLYIADESNADELAMALDAEGVNAKACLASGQLVILGKRDAYLKDGYFDPEKMIALLTEVERQAKADGYTALRGTGEMTWALGPEVGNDRLIEYESKLNYLIPQKEMVIICQYNRARFPADIILGVLQTHPLVIHGDEVLQNGQYIPPDEFLGLAGTGADVDRLLVNIRERNKTVSELKEARDFFHAVMHKTGDGILVLGPDGKIALANARAAGIFGRSIDDLTGIHFSELFDPASAKTFEADMNSLGTGSHGTSPVELKVNRPGHPENRPVALVSLAPIMLENVLSHIVVTAEDITMRKNFERTLYDYQERLEELVERRTKDLSAMNKSLEHEVSERRKVDAVLHESELRFRRIFETARVGIVMVDMEGKIELANDAFLELIGYTIDEVQGMKFAEFTHPEDLDGNLNYFQQLTEGKIDSYHLQKRYIRKNGSIASVDISVAGIFIESGLKRITAVVQDITERSRALDELERYKNQLENLIAARTASLRNANESLTREIEERRAAEESMRLEKERAEEATKLKDKFVSLVAHDIRSPFNSMLGLIRLIYSDKTNTPHDEHKAILRQVISTGERTVKMVEELLDISKVQSGAIAPKYRFFDSRTLVTSVLEAVEHLAHEKKITLANDVAVGCRLWADPDLYREIVLNLAGNAVKFTKPGGSIRAFSPANCSAELSISDTGVGIPQKVIPDLFRHDTRTTTTGTAGEKGTGWGLKLSNDLAMAMGGMISVESEPGKGSVFTLKLPFIMPQVMIIDDEQAVRMLYSQQLRSIGANVIEVESAEEALATLEQLRPHLIVCDISMPEMSGLDFLRIAKSDQRLKQIPVMMLTADSSPDTREESIRLGADDFVGKYTAIDEFIPRVRRFIF